MAEEASLALVDLLRQRNQTLDQQIQAVVRLNKRLEQQLDALHRESARKRRQLQRKIQEAQNALRLKDEDVRRLQRQLSEKIDAERARADKLEQLAADEAERRWTESVLRHLHTEPDGFDDGKRICDDPDTPKEMGKQNQKAQAVQSTCMASREEDVAITLAEMIPHLCGSWDNQEERDGNVDRLDFSNGPDQSVETDAYAGQVARQDQTQLLEEAREALSAHQETRWHDMMEREKVLTCPLSQDLFQEPVVTECCGKTSSWEPLRQAFSQTSLCPFCQAKEGWVHRNSDMAKLVELHRSERSALSDIAFITARTAAGLTAACARSTQRRTSNLDIHRKRHHHEKIRSQSTILYLTRRSSLLSSTASSAEDIADSDDIGVFCQAGNYPSNARAASPTAGEIGAPNISPNTVPRPLTSIDARRTCRYLFEARPASRAMLNASSSPGKYCRNYLGAASWSKSRSPVLSEPSTSLTDWVYELSNPDERRAIEAQGFHEYASTMLT